MNEPHSESLEPGACPYCMSANPEKGRFCKVCGAALQPPPACPECNATLPNDARFCPSCGIRVIGPRSDEALTTPSTQAATSSQLSKTDGPQTPTSPANDESQLAEPSKAALQAGQPAQEDALQALADASKKRRVSQGAGLGTNIFFFVAVLIAFIVGMYAWNKDKAKEASMFSGAPATPMPQSADTQAAPVDPSKSFTGKVRIDSKIANEIDTRGVLYIIVRNANMPNQGPPLAVKKISQPSFPLEFSISGADVMMKGMPFLGPFDVYVRLDRDGNAMTKGPEDLVPQGPKKNVVVGDRSVDIALARRLKDPAIAQKTGDLSSPKTNTPGNENSVQGTIKIDKAHSKGSDWARGTVYLIVRPTGMPPVGPPLAVRKYDSPVFPLSFRIGPEHVMMKQMPFTGPFDIYVRWDQDGNAMSKQAGDFSSKEPARNVSKGTNTVKLVLNERRK